MYKMKMKKALKMLLGDENKLNSLVSTVFAVVDKDGSGEIDELELFDALKGITRKGERGLKLEDVKAAMAELDTYTDGLITFEEFKAMVIAALNILYLRDVKVVDKEPDTGN